MDKNKIFYHHNLLARKLRKIEGFRKLTVVKPVEIRVTDCFHSEEIEMMPNSNEFSSIELPYQYGSVDDYMWSMANFENLDPTVEYYGKFDFGTGSGGLTCGAETLLYKDSVEWSGVDLNHTEVRLGSLKSNQTLVFRTWSGVADASRLEELEYIQGKREAGKFHTLATLELFELDTVVNNLYYNVYAMLEAYKALKESDITSSSRIINDLSKCLLKYDDHDITRELLYELDGEIQLIIDGYDNKSLVTMIALGQTHIDLAWLWRVKHTREKAARSFSTMLNLMSNNSEFTFLQSQPQLFAYLKNDYPKLYKRIKQAVANGQLEVDGAMWLESDCNIPSGESLIRQVMYGKQFIKEEFGSESKLLWMPDVFGYSSAMPQILKKSGVDVFCTTKMQWNQGNRMPFNSFKWRGIDGSEVSTHLVEDFKFFRINPESMISGWEKYRDKDLTDEVLYQYGFGDGGGGPRQEDIELVKRFDKIPGLPNIKYDKASNYFKRLDDKLNDNEGYVHTWDGEMYLELHRGTFTSQARMKLLNRRLEYKLRTIEMESAIAFQDGYNVLESCAILKQCWQLLMLNQFHDIIPGSSINGVYKDAEEVYYQCDAELDKARALIEANYELCNDGFMVFNSYHLPIDNSMEYKTEENLDFSIDGEKVVSCKTSDGYKLYFKNLRPLCYTKVTIEKIENNLEVKNNITNCLDFENDFYIIELNSIGQIIRLFDKELNRELLSGGKVFNKLVSYEDRPLNWDAWDIDIFYDKRERIVDEVIGYEVTRSNECEQIIEFTYKHFNSDIKQKITISNHTKRIDISHSVDYRDDHRLLRVLFETDIKASQARFDIQCGNIARPTHRNTSWDMQKFEVLGHKWADISNNSYGVSIINDCKYGYSAKDSTIGLTLIKAGQFPDKEQDITHHQYTYSIYPHSGDVLQSDIDRESHALNDCLLATQYNMPGNPVLTINNRNVYVDALKVSEDQTDIVMRIHEWSNEDVKIDSNLLYHDCDLLENELDHTEDRIKSYEIKTMRIAKEDND